MNLSQHESSRAMSQGFPARFRIRRGADFQRVYRRRLIASDDRLVLYGCENGLDFPRLGLSVSRKVGGAVQRNRWKRLLREAFRLGRHELPAGLDLVVVPRAGVVPELGQLAESLRSLSAHLVRKARRRAT
ncbi:MAG TPA: ribonuclease P protein component [Pirellulales bacterium]|jgi:ribonuclease P protein component|nr:ribonuclease P protein component [Pirellulales bacterium]